MRKNINCWLGILYPSLNILPSGFCILLGLCLHTHQRYLGVSLYLLRSALLMVKSLAIVTRLSVLAFDWLFSPFYFGRATMNMYRRSSVLFEIKFVILNIFFFYLVGYNICSASVSNSFFFLHQCSIQLLFLRTLLRWHVLHSILLYFGFCPCLSFFF